MYDVFVPKVFDHASSVQSVDQLAFQPPPFSSPEEERLHSLCSVCALYTYVQRTRTLCKSNQLFVSLADSYKGKPISRQRLSHWVVEAMVLCYNNKSIEPQKGLRARPEVWLHPGLCLEVFQFRKFAQQPAGLLHTHLLVSIDWM